jgi:hypothetical protein
MLRQIWVRALAAGALLLVSVVVLANSGARDFRIRDDCDPATFNAAFGNGTCAVNFDGDTTVDEFLEELAEDQEVGAWRFNPDEVTLDRGERTMMESRGGELHTFTRVEQFGGGIVPGLNELAGTTEFAPECGTPGMGDTLGMLAQPGPTNLFVFAGDKFAGPRAGSGFLPRGETKWQCCIHPWMRSTIKVR